MDLVVRCPCGWETDGPEEQVVAAAQAHGREAHGKEPTRTEIMTLARPAAGWSL